MEKHHTERVHRSIQCAECESPGVNSDITSIVNVCNRLKFKRTRALRVREKKRERENIANALSFVTCDKASDEEIEMLKGADLMCIVHSLFI